MSVAVPRNSVTLPFSAFCAAKRFTPCSLLVQQSNVVSVSCTIWRTIALMVQDVDWQCLQGKWWVLGK